MGAGGLMNWWGDHPILVHVPYFWGDHSIAGPITVNCHEFESSGVSQGNLTQLPVKKRVSTGILKVARPVQTRPNGKIPVQNDGWAGL